MPILYLRGLSTVRLPRSAARAAGNRRGRAERDQHRAADRGLGSEYRQFRQRDLADRDYVYVWVDGIHFNIRLEDDRLCTLVVIGARAREKELVALEDGYRESAEELGGLLQGLQRRGLEAPVVAVGDGALGFWSAVRGRVAPDGRATRPGSTSWEMSWTKMPKRLQPQANRGCTTSWRWRRASRPGTSRHLRRGVRGEVSESGRVPGDRPGGAPDLLRLSGQRLDSSRTT